MYFKANKNGRATGVGVDEWSLVSIDTSEWVISWSEWGPMTNGDWAKILWRSMQATVWSYVLETLCCTQGQSNKGMRPDTSSCSQTKKYKLFFLISNKI